MNNKYKSVALTTVIVLALVLTATALADSIYVVQRGDYLARIARLFDVTVNDIVYANTIANPNLIYPGQELVIPTDDDGGVQPTPVPTNPPPPQPTQPPGQGGGCLTYTVQYGDYLAKIARNFNVPVQQIINLNDFYNINLIYVGQVIKISCDAAPPPQPTSPPPQPTNPPPQPTNPPPTTTPAPTSVAPTPTAPPPTQVPPTATPPPTQAPPSGFALGGQTQSFASSGTMADIGMSWVKFQHKWTNGEIGNILEGRIADAHARGFRVLYSIPGADHSSINYEAYVTFLEQVAQLGANAPDAIEIWNEQNIDREWPSGQIDGATYTINMLKPAYERIKAANPNIMVISGAPAPTGYFGGGCTAAGCDDQPYLQAMAGAGAANYMDCIGIHYNEGILSPNATSGDPRGNPNHYTRYFGTMVNTYLQAFNWAKPLCFTEIGYLTGEDFGGSLPGGFNWANGTTLNQHAQWLGEAVTLSINNPNIQMMIIFNVDFTYYDPNGDPQAAFALVRLDGSCPACQPIKTAMGR